jgi:mono/diheme cytochrome c family protein
MKGFARLAIACIVLSFLFSLTSAADTGASLYRAKCAPCHGNNGEGKTSIKAPSLVSNEAKVLSDDKMRDLIRSRANGEMERNRSHADLKKRMNDDQIGRVITYIRKMQEKH